MRMPVSEICVLPLALSATAFASPKSSTFGDANQEGFDTIHRVHIGGVNFPLASDLQVRAFDKGRKYRAYYVKSTLPVILSAEPLD